MTDFPKGQKIFYPNQGICISQGLCRRTVLGQSESFYSFLVEANEACVMVPKGQVVAVGVRPIIPKKEIRKVLAFLRESESLKVSFNWKIRYEGNSERLASGSVYDNAAVLKCLAFVQKRKSLSFREQEMFDRAHSLVTSEMAAAGLPPKEVAKKVDAALAALISA